MIDGSIIGVILSAITSLFSHPIGRLVIIFFVLAAATCASFAVCLYWKSMQHQAAINELIRLGIKGEDNVIEENNKNKYYKRAYYARLFIIINVVALIITAVLFLLFK